MKPLYQLLFLVAFAIWSCGGEGLEPGQAKVNVEDTDEAKILTAASKGANILPEDGLGLIIIQEQDTALYVSLDGDTIGICDAVYHDPSVPWQAGKQIVVVKDNMAYCFSVVANKEGGLELKKVGLPKDGEASVEKLANGECGVRNMTFDDGKSQDFDFSPVADE
ncbi:MAG: hypothetical protein AAFZ15_13640 [Bacteroidota bacterium]